MTTLDDILYPDSREPQRQVQTHEQGRVISVDDSGIRFTLDSFPTITGFGPAPYPKWGNPTPPGGTGPHIGPQPGDRCLVVFAGPGISRPWVLGWWPR